MSRRKRMGFVPAIICCCLGLALLRDDFVWSVLMGAISIVSLFVRKRRLDTYGQWIALLLTAAAAYVWNFQIFPEWFGKSDGPLQMISRMGTGVFVGAATVRRFIRQPLYSHVADAMLLLFALLFLGIGNPGATYVWMVAVGVFFVLMGSWWSHVSYTEKVAGGRIRPAWIWGLFPAATIAALFIIAIPRAYEWTVNRYLDSVSIRATGFSPLLSLEALDHMFLSSEVVFRVFTPPSENRYFRGAVYNTYRHAHWSNSLGRERIPVPRLSENPAVDSVRGMAFMRVEAVEDMEHLFAPLHTAGIQLSGSATRDAFGLLAPNEGVDVSDYTLKLSSTPTSIVSPLPDDTAVPETMQSVLTRLVKQWVGGADTDRLKVERIAANLRARYAYALAFNRNKNEDPLLDFLVKNKQGHCEYFASAMALLARSAHVPTRVVGGYLLHEYNSIGGYYIVRERNAHTWCEVWLDGKWETVDATPSSMLIGQPGIAAFALDAALVQMKHFFASAAQLNRWFFIVGIGVLLLMWGLIRLFRTTRLPGKKMDGMRYSAPHDLYMQLQARMSGRLERVSNESLEAWAARMAQGDAFSRSAGELLSAYAAWRYGNVGNIDEIAHRCQRWIEDDSQF